MVVIENKLYFNAVNKLVFFFCIYKFIYRKMKKKYEKTQDKKKKYKNI